MYYIVRCSLVQGRGKNGEVYFIKSVNGDVCIPPDVHSTFTIERNGKDALISFTGQHSDVDDSVKRTYLCASNLADSSVDDLLRQLREHCEEGVTFNEACQRGVTGYDLTLVE